jgi:hypothetical protein
MAIPLHQRAHNVFLSHSSKDKLEFVDGLYHWLTQKAGLKVWFDRNLGSGQIAFNLGEAIGDSQAAIIVLSENSVRSTWVTQECSALEAEVGNSGAEFRIATVRLDDVDPPGLLRSFKHIDADKGALTPDAAALLMDTLFGGKESSGGRSVYLSRGWRPSEQRSAEVISEALQSAGMRLVCDWTGQPHYDRERIRGIIESTVGLAAILPHRGGGETSKYITDEIRMAQDAGLPTLVLSHKDVVAKPEWSIAAPLIFDNGIEKQRATEVAEMFGNGIEDFVRRWPATSRGEHIFLGHSLEASINDRFLTARGMLSRIAGLPIKVGGLVGGLEAQSEIIRLIREAALCIIDITNLTYEGLPPKIDFALNSSIEAGIALGAERPLYLTCRGPRRTPPFMFRNKQVWFYEDDLELIGNLRRIAAAHRRMVL